MFQSKFFKSIAFIRAVFLIALFILILLASITYRHIKDLDKTSAVLMNTYEISLELEQLMSYIKDAETGHRGFVITGGDSIYLDPYINARNNINISFEILNNSTKNNQNQQKHLKKIYNLVDKRFSYFKKDFKTQREFNTIFKEGKVVMDSIRREVSKMITLENKLLYVHEKIYKYNNSNTPLIIFSSFLISILILVLGYLRIIKNYKSLIKQNIELKIFDESSRQAEILGNYGSWVLNFENHQFSYSDNKFRLLGCEPQSFNPTIANLLEFVHPDDKHILIEANDSILKDESLPLIHYRIIRKNNNEIRHFRTIGKIFIDSLGHKNMIGTTQDITDDFNKKELIKQRNKELEQNNKELNEFNQVASHDLQEPLRKIQTFISRISEKEQDNLSESGKIYFEKIKQASSRMRVLIDDLLQYSRTNRSEKVFSKINLNEIAEESKIELSESIEEKKATINIGKLHTIKAVKFQLQQLFINIIGNSLKYAKKDVPPIITIRSKKVKAINEPLLNDSSNKEYIKIIFNDNGLGFDQAYAHKIFLLFNRLHSKNEFPGTGVGLAICKKIVENHKGYIFAEGVLNEGATFIIYLPK